MYSVSVCHEHNTLSSKFNRINASISVLRKKKLIPKLSLAQIYHRNTDRGMEGPTVSWFYILQRNWRKNFTLSGHNNRLKSGR